MVRQYKMHELHNYVDLRFILLLTLMPLTIVMVSFLLIHLIVLPKKILIIITRNLQLSILIIIR